MKNRIIYIFNRIINSIFVKNVLVVMTGTAIAQIVGFALTPIISRLFTPSEFGVFGAFTSVSTIIAAGVTLQYTQAIMLAKNEKDAFHLFIISCFSTCIVTSLAIACCSIIPNTLNNLIRTEGFWALISLVFATIAYGVNQSCQAWCVRVKAFKHTSASQVIRSLSSNGTQIGFGYLNTGEVGLIIAHIIANILATINLARIVVRDAIQMRYHFQWRRIRQLAYEYRDFPVYSASMNVVNSFSLGLPVLLLTKYYGIAVAGGYAFAMRIISVPMGFVLNALRQVLFQKAAEVNNNGEPLLPLYIKTTCGLLAMTIFPSIVIFLWAPSIFGWIFGSQWYMAGEFARSLVLWLMFMFCNLPAVLFARILRIQRKLFFFDIVILSARTIVLVVGGMYLSAVDTILLISIVGAVLNMIFIFTIGYILVRKEGALKINQL